MTIGTDAFAIFLINQVKDLPNNTLIIDSIPDNLKTVISDYFFYKRLADKIYIKLKMLKHRIKDFDAIELNDQLIEIERTETSYVDHLVTLGINRNTIHDMDNICFKNETNYTFGILSRLCVLSKEFNVIIKKIYP